MRVTKRFVTPKEFAEEMGFSLATVYKLLKKNKPWAIRFGRQWRIDREKALLEDHGEEEEITG